MINLYVKAVIMKEKMMEALKGEEGLGTIEIAIIIIVLIGLALLFRTQIEALLNTIFGNINKDAGGIKIRNNN